jgi:hypothetical protein
VHYCFWLDLATQQATYIPIASRIRLTTGRPVPGIHVRSVMRKPITGVELIRREEAMAEVDCDLADKHHIVANGTSTTTAPRKTSSAGATTTTNSFMPSSIPRSQIRDDDDDDDDDFGNDDDDSDSGNEMLFGGNTKTIVAEQ